MATRKASIGAELTVDRRQFKKALDESTRDAKSFTKSLESMKGARSFFDAPKGKFWGSGIATDIKSAGSIFSQAAQLLRNVVEKPAQANAWYGDLKDSMIAVTRDAELAKDRLGELFAVAREQNMDEAQINLLVRAFEKLVTLGHDSGSAVDFLRELANAAEAGGRSFSEAASVVAALDKIGQRGESSVKTLAALGQ